MIGIQNRLSCVDAYDKRFCVNKDVNIISVQEM